MESEPPPRETVLVVDDEGYIRDLICAILSLAGYTALKAAGGDEALAVAGAHAGAIDLLLTDVVMPGMDGKALSERFLGLRPQAKVLFVSGYSRAILADHGVDSETSAFLGKPFTPKALLAAIRSLLKPQAALAKAEDRR